MMSLAKPFSIHLNDIFGGISDENTKKFKKQGSLNLKFFYKNRICIECLQNSKFQSQNKNSSLSSADEELFSNKNSKKVCL